MRYFKPIRFDSTIPLNERATSFFRTQLGKVVKRAESLGIPFVKQTLVHGDYRATYIYNKAGVRSIFVEYSVASAEVESTIYHHIFRTYSSEFYYNVDSSIRGFSDSLTNTYFSDSHYAVGERAARDETGITSTNQLAVGFSGRQGTIATLITFGGGDAVYRNNERIFDIPNYEYGDIDPITYVNRWDFSTVRGACYRNGTYLAIYQYQYTTTETDELGFERTYGRTTINYYFYKNGTVLADSPLRNSDGDVVVSMNGYARFSDDRLNFVVGSSEYDINWSDQTVTYKESVGNYRSSYDENTLKTIYATTGDSAFLWNFTSDYFLTSSGDTIVDADPGNYIVGYIDGNYTIGDDDYTAHLIVKNYHFKVTYTGGIPGPLELVADDYSESGTSVNCRWAYFQYKQILYFGTNIVSLKDPHGNLFVHFHWLPDLFFPVTGGYKAMYEYLGFSSFTDYYNYIEANEIETIHAWGAY